MLVAVGHRQQFVGGNQACGSAHAFTSLALILTHIADGDNGLVEHRDLGGAAHVAAGHRNRLGQIVGAFPTHRGGDVRVLGSGGDDATDVCATVLAPVPHVEGVRAVVCVAAAV